MKLAPPLCLLLACLLFSCSPSTNEDNAIVLEGNTMGSGFKIVYIDSLERDFSVEVDSFLRAFSAELSTYDSSSTISRANSTDSFLLDSKASPLLYEALLLAKSLYKETEGWCNPAVLPLVEYWGFGKERGIVDFVDSSLVEELRTLTVLDSIYWQELEGGYRLIKQDARQRFDVNSFAPGYAADLLADFFEGYGINRYLIDVGGEMRAKGLLSGKYCWRVGVNVPELNAQARVEDVLAVVRLCDRALATSGNYRNFREVGGKRYAHTLNPHTGYPAQNELLSVTVLAPTAAAADAYATACMAMGLEKAKLWVAKQPEVEAYFIYGDTQGGYATEATAGMLEFLERKNN